MQPFLQAFSRFSFRIKLIVSTLGALFVLLGLLAWQTWALLESELRGQLQGHVERIDTLLTASLALPLAQRDYATLADMAERLVKEGNVTHLVIVDHRGKRVAQAGWPSDASLPEAGTERTGVRHARTPIDFAGQTLGEAHYGLALRFIDEAHERLVSRLLRIGLFGIFVALLLLLPLDVWLSHRLGMLERAARRFAEGQLDARIELPGSDELSRLAGAFNQMADRLRKLFASLKRSEERFQRAVAGSNDGIWDWDLEHGEYYFSPRCKALLGYRDDEIPSEAAAMENLVLPEDRPLLAEARRRHFEERRPFDCIFRARHKDGHVVWCRSRGQAQWDAQGKVVRFSGATSDITELKQAAMALERLAHFDPLTQLPNRALLADRMTMALAQARRDGQRVAVALLDLDGFKPVNDTYGHAVGDRVLVEVADRLRATLRETDTIARLGGDEFVLVLSGTNETSHYLQILGRVLGALAQPYPVDGEQVDLSASIGVTFFPEDNGDADALIRHADQAMYAAKQAGRNRVHIFDADMDRDIQAQRNALARLGAALEAGELRLYYQPKADLRAMRIVGVEALLRWQHPERGLLGPNEFLPLVEQDRSLAIRLSAWVIDTALA
ncbi:MAG: putative bifunctional diguanylate cyclase/phosphodiesterase, partial [Rhodocyclaceae bacterium]